MVDPEDDRKSLVRRVADRFVSGRVRRRVRMLETNVGELGVDPFGFDPKAVQYAMTPMEWLYRYYFRVRTEGLENVPDGRALLIANHSGQLTFDGMMIAAACVLDRDPPRGVRSMVERWIPRLPWVSVFFARVGQVVGTPDNARRLLERDEAILVFPEGVAGIAKPFADRYQLQPFGTGFMRLALQTGSPIVPVGVIGAEEQAPALMNLKPLARLLGLPAFPVTPTFPLLGPLGLLPLPTRYRIIFGEPMRFEGEGNEEDEIVTAQVQDVRSAISSLLVRGLEERESIFR